VTAKLWIKILRCSQAANFLFANKGTGEGFSEVLATGSQQRHCIHIVDKDGNTPLTELGQLFLVSKSSDINSKTEGVNDVIEV
jgi:hypothetical protein